MSHFLPRRPRALAVAAPRPDASRITRTLLAIGALALAALAIQTPGAHAQNIGIKKQFMDLKASPCEDFYRYANGAWLDSASIPASYTGIGAGREMFDRNQETMYQVLEGARNNAAEAQDPTVQKLGFLYASVMDSVRANSEGWKPLEPELAAIQAIGDKVALRKYFARMNKQGIAVPFNFGPEADPKQSSQNIAQIYQAGLGLPDRDYYFKTDPKSDTLRREYVGHLAKLFTMTGDAADVAAKKAAAVMKIETALAESSMTKVEQRDPKALYNKVTVKKLGTYAPAIDWVAYFNEVGATQLAKADAQVDVSQPKFVRQVSRLVETTPLDDWKAYLAAHSIRAAAPWMSQAFFDESFRFGSLISGAKAPLPRWKRASGVVDAAMGEALGKAYVDKVFPPSSKAKMLELVNNLQASLRERIETREWMSADTKKQALVKLNAIMKKIGYPDTWRDYSALRIDPTAPGLVNLKAAQQFEASRQLAKVGKPVDRTEWLMSPPTVNAYYNPPINEIVFPAGILMPPQFDPNAPDPVNYGAIGMVIGHELTHGFDDEGRQYDAQGNLKDWWTAEDGKKFDARAQKVVDQYNGYVAVDTLHVNGKLTLGENIADLGGITIAFYAMQRAMKDKPHDAIGGFTPEQLFFLSYAQSWRRKMRPEIERLRTLTDPHSPAQYRVNGPLSNFPEFSKAFACKGGEKMVADDKVRAEIW